MPSVITVGCGLGVVFQQPARSTELGIVARKRSWREIFCGKNAIGRKPDKTITPEAEKRLAWNYSSTSRKQGQRGCCPFPLHPKSPLTQPPLRFGQILLDHSEHLLHNHHASVATLRLLFTFAPECRSASLRNRCSPSPEYPPSRVALAVVQDTWRQHR